MSDFFLGFLFVLALYMTVWFAMSGIDRQHCEDFGMEYSRTTITLQGYCYTPGRKYEIPAELVY